MLATLNFVFIRIIISQSSFLLFLPLSWPSFHGSTTTARSLWVYDIITQIVYWDCSTFRFCKFVLSIRLEQRGVRETPLPFPVQNSSEYFWMSVKCQHEVHVEEEWQLHTSMKHTHGNTSLASLLITMPFSYMIYCVINNTEFPSV